jgi:hypothetical protein
MTWRCAGIGSYRYGSSVLWTVEGDLAGSGAARFAGRVELFFRSTETSLLIDLREARLIDSAGAAVLARLRSNHPGLSVIGRPATWDSLPIAVRHALLGLDAEPSLVAALTRAQPAATFREQRRDTRIPLQLPVELFRCGRCAPAALADISRGGVRISAAPELFDAALRAGEEFDILGLSEDPLGRELVGAGASPVRLASVRGSLAAGLGARFADSPPPV